jgi:hypothetical protein
MKTKQKNNKILPATSACCGAVVRNECMDHFSFQNRNLIDALQVCTTSALSPSHETPPSCEGEECTSCAPVVKVSFPFQNNTDYLYIGKV